MEYVNHDRYLALFYRKEAKSFTKRINSHVCQIISIRGHFFNECEIGKVIGVVTVRTGNEYRMNALFCLFDNNGRSGLQALFSN